MSPASDCHPASPAPPALGDWATGEGSGEHRVAVLSASLLRTVMSTYGESCQGLAARAGIAAEVVAEAACGVRPAWALPYEEFTAIADAVAAVWPSAVFETAAACDLLLSCVLNGDQVMATDALTEPCSRELAWELLRLAITREPGEEIGMAEDGLLPDDLLALLSERAAALATSGSPDAWVGTEIFVACLSRQP